MMGINPLLDTLLVQIQKNKTKTEGVGRRPLNGPVVKAEAAQQAQRAHSDSRLNENAKNPGVNVQLSSNAIRSTVLPSTLTTLNPAAQTIAAILKDYPLQVATSAFVFPQWSERQLMRTPVLSQFLTDFMRLSGLFFESHLARWHAGELTLNELRSMRGSSPLLEFGFSHPFLPDNLKHAPLSDRINYMIRHQLDLLTCPIIHFEGKAGPDFSMVLLAYLFCEQPSPPQLLDFGQKQDSPDPITGWCLALRFEHPSFGYTEIEITESSQLDIVLRTPSMIFMEYARRDTHLIKTAISEIGYDDANVHLEQVEVRENASDCIKRHTAIAREHQNDGNIASMLDKYYGSLSDRILLQAQEHDAPLPDVPELFPLLMNLDMDKHIPTRAFDVAGYMVNWAIQQIQHVKF